jgi:Flp pilus assembly protein TadG
MSRQLKIKTEQGQTMAEFTLVLPIFVVLLFGIIQFGIAYNNYVTLTDAARAGARKGAVSRNVGPQTACEDQVKASATGLDSSKLQVTCSPTGGWAPGTDIRVDAQYPFTISLFGIPITTGSLKSVMTERME